MAKQQLQKWELKFVTELEPLEGASPVSQAQKAILLLDHTAKGASTSSEEFNAQISPRTDDEHNLPYHEDYLQEH